MLQYFNISALSGLVATVSRR